MRYRNLMIQDVGGIKNEENRVMRRGLLYRSGDLHRVTANELAFLNKLGIRQVVDLREEEMLLKRPDHFTAPRMVNLPVRLGRFGELKLRAALRAK